MIFRGTLVSLLLCSLISVVFGCEPQCRKGVAHAFAEFYTPVVQLAVDGLQDTFSSTLFNVTVPQHLSAFVPEDALTASVLGDLSETLKLFVDQATGKPLQDGIFAVMFSEADPFKGDCNHPRRLTRNMPPPGESWTREECEKMDYICGNPPSICHFLPMIKQRIIGRIRSQLESYATFDNGFLVRNVVQTVKQSTQAVMSEYGAGSMLDDPSVTNLINNLVSNAVRSLDIWAAVHVKELCTRPDQKETCDGWDEEIIPEILKWP